MPTTKQTAKKVILMYKQFPASFRPAQEDIIRVLRGEIIRGKSIHNPDEIKDKQIYKISRRLYFEARDLLQEPKQGLEEKVDPQEQLVLFKNEKAHWQY